MKKYVYKTKRIDSNIEDYLNKQAEEGWRCVSVSASTGLGWTHLAVFEKEIETEDTGNMAAPSGDTV